MDIRDDVQRRCGLLYWSWSPQGCYPKLAGAREAAYRRSEKYAELACRSIKEVYGERPVKVIVSPRDPASRAYSWYWKMVREGREDLDFEEALLVEEYWLKQNRSELYQLGSIVYGYATGSRYPSLLQPYLDLFPPESFFFVLQNDLKSRVNETCEEIFEFLGIESSTQVNTSKSNPAAMPRSRLLHKTLRQRSLFKEFIKPFIPMRVRRPLKAKMMRVKLKETPMCL